MNFDAKGVGLPSDATFLWNFGDGSTSTDAAPSHTYTKGGTFTPTLTLSTAKGLFSKVLSLPSIIVSFVGQIVAKPHAIATGSVERPVKVTGVHGVDPSGLPPDLKFLWDWGDGTTDTSSAPTHSYDLPETTAAAKGLTFQPKLHLSSEAWAQSLDFLLEKITVMPSFFQTPSFYQGNKDAPSNVQFFPQNVTTPPVSDRYMGLSLLWDFGDGSTDASSTPTHTYQKSGSYTPSLVVKSALTGIEKAFHLAMVTVAQGPQRTISAAPTADKTTTDTSTPVALISGVSMGDGGPIVSDLGLLWDFGDGSPTDGSAGPSHTYANPGSYNVSLKVSSLIAGFSKLFQGLIIKVQAPISGLFAAPTISGPGGPTAQGADGVNPAEDENGTPVPWAPANGPFAEPGDTIDFFHGFQGIGGGAGAMFEASVSSGRRRDRIRKHLSRMNLDVTAPGSIVSITWDHGDGSSYDSSSESPTAGHLHSYSSEGNYSPSVTITAKDPISGKQFSHKFTFPNILAIFQLPKSVDVNHGGGSWHANISDYQGKRIPNTTVLWRHYGWWPPAGAPDHTGHTKTDSNGVASVAWGDTGVVGTPAAGSGVVWYPLRNPFVKNGDHA